MIHVCASHVHDRDAHTTVFDGGFISTSGDGIIGVTAPASTSDSILGDVEKRSESAMDATHCFSLDENDRDRTRSPYVSQVPYQGLWASQKVSTSVNMGDMPRISTPPIQEPSHRGVRPEGPWPAGFPTSTPAPPEKPSYPNATSSIPDGGFSMIARYRIVDGHGPGCGWVWSGQQSPVPHSKELHRAQTRTLLDAHHRVDSQARTYVENTLDWTAATMGAVPSVIAWNEWVHHYDSVVARWEKLRQDRYDIHRAWLSYVAAHDVWLTFDTRKAQATSTFNTQTTQCQHNNDAYAAWRRQWGAQYDAQQKAGAPQPTPSTVMVTPPPDPWNPSPTPTPSTIYVTPSPSASSSIPPPPTPCTSPPQRPAIIDEQKPAEPKPPAIPRDVTIPSSWPHPHK